MTIRRLAAAVLLAAVASPTALAIDAAHHAAAREMIDKAIAWLRTQQDQTNGGWSVNPDTKGPNYPAITGLVVTGMLMDPAIDAEDESVQRGVKFILSYVQPDGGIYDKVLPSYNTSICLSALAQVQRSEAAGAIKPAQDFLRSLQWSEDSLDAPTETGKVTKDHPFYGGIGYGKHGRPDNSNLGLMIQGMHDSGLSSTDPAYQRALVFLSRTQMVDSVNDQEYADGTKQGGFIYATAENKDTAGRGQSHAATIEETMDDGTKVSRLRCYGSMTYTGFKSLIYANLDRKDPRVQSAYDWLRANYTMQENPGMGDEGMYYYFLSLARALDAWGSPQIETIAADGATGEVRDWANDLVDRLKGLQNPDGSFRTIDDRWMENNPVLITAYALIALQEAAD